MADVKWVVKSLWPRTGLKSEAVFTDYAEAWWYWNRMLELGTHTELKAEPEPVDPYHLPRESNQPAESRFSNGAAYVAMGALALMFLFAFLYFRELHNG